MKYLLDANIFIEAKNRYYGMDIAPGFWSWLEVAHEEEVLGTIRGVYNEIVGGEDDLARWLSARPTFAIDVQAEDGPNLTALSDWLTSSGRYESPAIADFLSVADYQLVAQAATRGCIVVTHEIPSVGKRVKIPDACNAMSVPWMDPFSMLRAEGAQLHIR